MLWSDCNLVVLGYKKVKVSKCIRWTEDGLWSVGCQGLLVIALPNSIQEVPGPEENHMQLFRSSNVAAVRQIAAISQSYPPQSSCYWRHTWSEDRSKHKARKHTSCLNLVLSSHQRLQQAYFGPAFVGRVDCERMQCLNWDTATDEGSKMATIFSHSSSIRFGVYCFLYLY